MTTPQDLADRLEKAIGGYLKAFIGDPALRTKGLDIVDIAVINRATILASLRRSAPASGEMREAVEQLRVLVGIADERVTHWRSWQRNEQTRGEKSNAQILWSLSEAELISQRLHKALDKSIGILRTPSGETREEAGS